MITKAPLISFKLGLWQTYNKADVDLGPDDLYVWWTGTPNGQGINKHFKPLLEHMIREKGYPILVRYFTHPHDKEQDGLFLVENDTDAIQAILSYSDMLVGEGA